MGVENRQNSLTVIQKEIAPLKEALRNIAVLYGKDCAEFAGLEAKEIIMSFVMDKRDKLPEKIPVGPNLVFDIDQQDLVPVGFKTIEKIPIRVWSQYSGLIASGIEHQMQLR